MTSTPAEPKTGDCSAGEVDGLMICERCGLEWLAGGVKPPCEPITFDRMRLRLIDQERDDERSYNVVKGLKVDGVPASTVPARRKLAETRKLLKLLDLVVFNPALKKAVIAARDGKKLEDAGE